MRRSILLGLAAALLAGCSDTSPTLGDDRFPPGTAPVTLEAAIPSETAFEELGRFSGYSGPATALFRLVARDYGGALDANTLGSFIGFPTSVAVRVGEETVGDTVFHYGPGELVVRVDSLGTAPVPGTVELWEAAQAWDPATASWTVASDTAGVRTLWQEPGGTRGALLSAAAFTADFQEGDSLVFQVDSTTMQRLADGELPGLLLRSATTGTRIQLQGMTLRGVVHATAADTAVAVQMQSVERFVFTPEPPEPATAWHAGGVRSARTLFRVDPEMVLPGCPAAEAPCPPVRLRDVNVHRVTLRLRPVPVPLGFEPRAPVPLTLRVIDEPELGPVAPLGPSVLDTDRGVLFTPGDTLVDIGITSYTLLLLQRDDLSHTLALLAEPSPGSPLAPATFGVAWFDPQPELFVTYTLPARPRDR
jgi:hypothetical protein